MTRVRRASIVGVLAGLAVVVAASACRRPSAERTPDPPAAPTPAPVAKQPAPVQHDVPAASGKPPILPEDPVAGKRSELQWREHMQEEEDERQALFDGQHLKQHRAVVKLIVAARTRYDRARTEAALAKVLADMPGKVEAIEKLVTEIDPKRVNSRLLPDYAALQLALSDTYPEARLAALKGDAHPLEQARADFDQRMKKIAAWLKEAAESEHE